MTGKGMILVVDDEAREVENRVNLLDSPLKEGVTVCYPGDVKSEMIEDADLVLVDYKLERWTENNGVGTLANRVPNGIALTSILQQHLISISRPTAFALHSEHLWELTAPFPPEQRVHLLARAYNFDWAFVKTPVGGSPATTFARAHILANAVSSLPHDWPEANPDKAREIARGLLKVPEDQPWGEQAWEDAEMAHPPLDELTLRIHGILFLRWLLTRVLYYPCFLLDRYWVAARLGSTPSSVDMALEGTLGTLLEPAKYKGVLEGFAGRRWWRSGLESILWDLSGGAPAGTEEMHQLFETKLGITLAPATHPYPVVCLDANYKPLDDLFAPQDTIRLQLDDWPSHADLPRTSREMIEDNPRLRGLILRGDRELLDK